MANEDKSTRYRRLHRRASLAGTVWQLTFLLGLVVTGAAAAIRDRVGEWAGAALVPRVVLYVVLLGLAYEVVHLPLGFYQDVALERRYGLSTESTGRWLRERLKSAVVALLCVVAAALLVSGLLRWSQEWWWAAAAVCFTLVLVLVVQLAPVFLFPLFYDLSPLSNEALSRRLSALAARAGTPVLGVFEWRLSGHTKKGNAALVGLGRTRRILVSDTLLARHSEEEIEAVLAHELAHHLHGDIWSATALEAVLIGLGSYAADRVLTACADAGAFLLQGKTDLAALPLLALAGGAVSLGLLPLSNALSRAHERRADRVAIEMTGNAEAFISAMRRLAAQNLAEERPPRLVELFFHTHPGVTARIEAARKVERADGAA